MHAGRTPLHWAAANGTACAVDTLLRAGANQRIRNADGMTALELANHFNNAQTIPVCVCVRACLRACLRACVCKWGLYVHTPRIINSEA